MSTTTLRTSNRLQTIVTRQRSNKLRDALFAAFIVLLSTVSIATVGAAVAGSAVHVVR